MTPKQKKFLRLRLREAASEQPDLKRLKTLLLRLGGEYLVAPPKPDGIVPFLLELGFLTGGPTTLRIMKDRLCLENVAAVWKARRFGIIAIATIGFRDP
jgi:hypothetical protein